MLKQNMLTLLQGMHREKAEDMDREEKLYGSLDAMGDVIRKYRRKSGRTQAELAADMDVTRNAVVNWENNRARPQMEVLMKLTHLLSIPIPELFDAEMAAAGLTAAEQKLIRHYRELSGEDQETADGILQLLREREENARMEMLRDQYRPVATLETPAAAGPGCDYLDNTAAQVRFYRKNPRYDDADLVCRVCGHSMEPYYRDGDYVYARAASSAEDGADVICDSNDGRMIKRRSGSILMSLNPAPEYRVHKSEDDDVHIVAVVLGVVPEDDRAGAEMEPELEEIHQKEVRALQQRLHLE